MPTSIVSLTTAYAKVGDTPLAFALRSDKQVAVRVHVGASIPADASTAYVTRLFGGGRQGHDVDGQFQSESVGEYCYVRTEDGTAVAEVMEVLTS